MDRSLTICRRVLVTMGVGSSCTAGEDGCVGLWFSVLKGLGWVLTASPSTAKGGGKETLIGRERAGS